jgi:hypothetical protein
MKLNIVVTSKPVDGLLYYSYEYCSYLNEQGIDAKVIIIPHRQFSQDDYLQSISNKYIHCKNIEFSCIPAHNDITLVMGRSMITLSYQSFSSYTTNQQLSLQSHFSNNIISVYSDNHPLEYPRALTFYKPKRVIDLCDTEVYPNGKGIHFEKTINFKIFKPMMNNIQFKHLFLGTNEKYYSTVEQVIDQYPDHGILTYNDRYVNINNNNIFVPVENLISMFDTYVYTKDSFDPAPRIFQECKYFGKDVIYLRDKNLCDGGSVYWKRNNKELDITEIVYAMEIIHGIKT